MAITFDAASTLGGDADNPLQWDHTVAAGDSRFLLVCVSITWLDVQPTVTGITYGGDALSFIGAQDHAIISTKRRVEMWYMVAPKTGTNQISITFDNNPTRTVGAASSWIGVAQTATLGTFVSAMNTSNAPTVDASSATDEVVMDALSQAGADVATATASGTERWNAVRNTTRSAGQTKPGNTSVTMNWTLSASKIWCLGAVSVKPATASNVEVNAVVVTADAAVSAPSVVGTANVSVSAVVAVATAEVLLPGVSSGTSVNTEVVTATATATVLLPAITATANPAITAALATADAEVLIPVITGGGAEEAETVGTSGTNLATRTTLQRKGFYAATRFWQFYHDDANIVYRTSSDGVIWSDTSGGWSVSVAGAHGAAFSLCFDGTYLHYVCARDSTAFYYRQGVPNSDGTITWSAAEQTITGSIAFVSDPTIAVDSNGYPWVSADESNICHVMKSSTKDGTWTTETTWTILSSDDVLGELVALTGGKMYMVYFDLQVDGPVLGKLYDGSSWGAAEEIATSHVSTEYCSHASVTAIEDDVHVAFQQKTTNGLIYVKRTYGVGWGAEETVLESGVLANSPVISADVNGDLYVFWVSAPTVDHVYYRKRTTSWGVTQDWLDESAVPLYVKGSITCYPKVLEGYLGVAWTTNAGMNVRHASLLLLHDVAVTAEPATAVASLLSPVAEVTAGGNATVEAVVVTALAAVLAPSVVGTGLNVSVTAEVAVATCTILAPNVSGTTAGDASVTAVVAVATADVLSPSVTVVRNVSIAVVTATATASVPLPMIAGVDTSIPLPAATGVGWQGLIGMFNDFRRMRTEDARTPLVSCPLCGGQLDYRNGVFNCKMGHFQTRKNTQEQ